MSLNGRLMAGAGLIGTDGRPLSSAGKMAAPVDTRPLVAVCIPSQDDWKAAMSMSLIGMLFDAAMVCKPMIKNEMGASITYSRNCLVAAALESEAKYVLFVDSDLVFPPDALRRLLKHDRDIVGATYTRKRAPYDILGFPKNAPEKVPVGGSFLQEMEYMPPGFMLIKAEVFDRLPKPWFFERYDANLQQPFCAEGPSFCMHAADHGYQIWMDLDLTFQMGHLGMHAFNAPKPQEAPTHEAAEQAAADASA